MKALWNNLSFFQAASMIAVLVLTVGVIVEYWAKLKPLARLLLKLALLNSTPFERCVLRQLLLHAVAPILVVVGIAGELLFETRSFIIEDHEAEALQAATAKEIGARLALEEEFLRAGPRYVLFTGKGKQFRDSLRPFSGQKLDLRTALRSLDNPEVRTLQTLLFGILTSTSLASPKWIVTMSEQTFVSPEIMVGISNDATDRTKLAATALAKALGELGLSDVNDRVPPPVEVFAEGSVAMGDRPARDTVWLLIGQHMLLVPKALDGEAQ